MGVLFQIHFWDQSHVTIVCNTRETGDINDFSTWTETDQGVLLAFFYLGSRRRKHFEPM